MYRIKGFSGVVLPNLEEYFFNRSETQIPLDLMSPPQTNITHQINQNLAVPELVEQVHSHVTFDPDETVVTGLVRYFRYANRSHILSNILIEGRVLKGTMIPGITGRIAVANLDMRPNLGVKYGGGATPTGTLDLI